MKCVCIQKMSEISFKGIFTSLHIPKDDALVFVGRLKELDQIAKNTEMKLKV
ncbi:MupG family TIM beta-alpha barrel fold protein [Enterococcus plantarum]|uniref:MupG family TIM beta-alpha barrel fold protein n=1 Tax=Enterococcus TaxID=1350 RepID=UPI001428B656|nr:MupG family TIM beta-alpha barrel fold protein [Enterococcus plantarum]MBO0421495.1 hypothetical protein [Enterococcus plantarum]